MCCVGEDRRDVVTEHGERAGLPNVMAAFQILSEARSRMFRSNFSRPLLEMALVQISLLENLSAISSLLSGNLPELPQGHTTAVETGKKKLLTCL